MDCAFLIHSENSETLFFSRSSCGAFNAPWNKNKIILAAMTINVTAAFYHFLSCSISIFTAFTAQWIPLVVSSLTLSSRSAFERSTFHIAVITAPQRTCLVIPTEKLRHIPFRKSYSRTLNMRPSGNLYRRSQALSQALLLHKSCPCCGQRPHDNACQAYLLTVQPQLLQGQLLQ